MVAYVETMLAFSFLGLISIKIREKEETKTKPSYAFHKVMKINKQT